MEDGIVDWSEVLTEDRCTEVEQVGHIHTEVRKPHTELAELVVLSEGKTGVH